MDEDITDGLVFKVIKPKIDLKVKDVILYNSKRC